MADAPTWYLEHADDKGGVRLTLAPADGPGVVVSAAAAARLRSTHVERFEAVALDGKARTEKFQPDVPNVAEEKLAHLDERGFARIGTEVRAGDLLVGKIAIQLAAVERRSEEEVLLDQIFGGLTGARDASMRVPPGVHGTVTAVRPSDDGRTVELEVTGHRDLTVGDVLEVFEGTEVVVAIGGDTGGADLRWGDLDGPRRVVKAACAEDAYMARSIGPYSLITQQPLGGKAAFGGQRVGTAELTALEARGAWRCAHELLTVKSDDVSGRVRTYEAIVKGESEVAGGVPESVAVLVRELQALAFAVDEVAPAARGTGPDASADPLDRLLHSRPPPPERAGWRLSFAPTAAVRQLSRGQVKLPETLNYRTLRPVDDGLFCTRIFGPVKDYECSCGKYRRMKDRGVVCEVCGVEVVQSRVRREWFGHVELPAPVVHPLALDLVATLLGRPPAEVRAIAYSQALLDGRDPAGDWGRTGGRAIREALRELDLDALAAGDGERAQLARLLRASGLPPDAFVYDHWPVLPPDLRPLVPLDDGRFATSDLNDLYRRLINRANRTRRLLELDAPGIIVTNEQKQLQESVDSLVLNGLRGKKITGPDRIPLRSLVDLLAGERGRFRFNLAGKRVDYSAVACVVPDATLLPGHIGMPFRMAQELLRPWVYGDLEQAGVVTRIKAAKALVDRAGPEARAAIEGRAARHPVLVGPAEATGRIAGFAIGRLTEGFALALRPDDAAALEIAWGEQAVVHVPVDARAIAEVRERLGVRPELPAVGPLHARLRPWIVGVADCGSDVRSVAACRAERSVCAACSGFPLGTPIGLLAAEALGDAMSDATSADEAVAAGADRRFAELLGKEPVRSWLARAAAAEDPHALAAVLVDAAIHAEVDPVTDPQTRSLLGRMGWDAEHDP